MAKLYLTIPSRKKVPLFIFGDHASRHIPPDLNDLGLTGDDLTRHIAWDIGTEAMIERLTDYFGCEAHVCGFSRLVIDPNRDPSDKDAIPAISDGSPIPGNKDIDPAARVNDFHVPYHAGLKSALDACHDSPLIITLHSFTPHPLTGDKRELDIGLLVNHDPETAEKFKSNLESQNENLRVAINEPYSGMDYYYSMDRHVTPRGWPGLGIEVNQALVGTNEDAISMADILARAIEPLLEREDVT